MIRIRVHQIAILRYFTHDSGLLADLTCHFVRCRPLLVLFKQWNETASLFTALRFLGVASCQGCVATNLPAEAILAERGKHGGLGHWALELFFARVWFEHAEVFLKVHYAIAFITKTIYKNLIVQDTQCRGWLQSLQSLDQLHLLQRVDLNLFVSHTDDAVLLGSDCRYNTSLSLQYSCPAQSMSRINLCERIFSWYEHPQATYLLDECRLVLELNVCVEARRLQTFLLSDMLAHDFAHSGIGYAVHELWFTFHVASKVATDHLEWSTIAVE